MDRMVVEVGVGVQVPIRTFWQSEWGFGVCCEQVWEALLCFCVLGSRIQGLVWEEGIELNRNEWKE